MKQIKVRDLTGKRTHFTVAGPDGAVEFHVWDEDATSGALDRCGGVEYHFAKQGNRSDSQKHEHCWYIDGPCWHDGTSLWASEYWIPKYERLGDDWVWSALESEYLKLEGDDE